MTIATSRRAGRGAQIARLFCCLFRHRQCLFDSHSVFFPPGVATGGGVYSPTRSGGARQNERGCIFLFSCFGFLSLLFFLLLLLRPPLSSTVPIQTIHGLGSTKLKVHSLVGQKEKERGVVVLFVVRPCHCVGNLLVCLWW